MSASISNFVTPPLPATREAMEAQRVVIKKPSLLDEVDRIHGMLWDDQTDEFANYRDHFFAILPGDSVTGSVKFDQFVAAQMIIAKADALKIHIVTDRKPYDVHKALSWVKRRLNLSAAQRKAQYLGRSSVDETEEMEGGE